MTYYDACLVDYCTLGGNLATTCGAISLYAAKCVNDLPKNIASLVTSQILPPDQCKITTFIDPGRV